MTHGLSLSTTILVFGLFAANSSAQMPSGAADPLSSHVEGQAFKANVKPGFHFNETAPNQLKVDDQSLKPETLKRQDVEFRLPSANFKSLKATLYVCDDALTFCQPRTIQIGAEGRPEAAPVTPEKKQKAVINKIGFIQDDLQEGLGQAKAGKKLVLADFSARWCPGCMRLETEIFGTPEFKNKTKGFVKVRIDNDRFENAFLKDKYTVHGIPALIVMTADGKEISRLIDYQPMAIIAGFLSSAQETPQPFDELKTRADAGDKKAIENLGKRLSAADHFEESLPYLEKIQPPPVELLDAKVRVARNKFKPPQAGSQENSQEKGSYVTALKNAIQSEPKSTRSIIWRTDLIPLLNAKDPLRKTLYTDGLALSDELLAANHEKLLAAFRGDLIGEFEGYETLLLASDRADLVEAGADNPAAILEAKKKVADLGRQLKIPIKRLGPSMRYLIFLVGAEDWQEAETLAKALLKANENSTEIQRRLIAVLNGEKKYAEAVQVGKECLPHSFGMNEVWAARQLAKAYAGEGQKEEARKILNAYLNREDIYWAKMGNERKTFEDLLASIK